MNDIKHGLTSKPPNPKTQEPPPRVRHLPRQRTAAGRAQPHRWREPRDDKGMGGHGVAVGARMGQRQKFRTHGACPAPRMEVNVKKYRMMVRKGGLKLAGNTGTK